VLPRSDQLLNNSEDSREGRLRSVWRRSELTGKRTVTFANFPSLFFPRTPPTTSVCLGLSQEPDEHIAAPMSYYNNGPRIFTPSTLRTTKTSSALESFGVSSSAGIPLPLVLNPLHARRGSNLQTNYPSAIAPSTCPCKLAAPAPHHSFAFACRRDLRVAAPGREGECRGKLFSNGGCAGGCEGSPLPFDDEDNARRLHLRSAAIGSGADRTEL